MKVLDCTTRLEDNAAADLFVEMFSIRRILWYICMYDILIVSELPFSSFLTIEIFQIDLRDCGNADG